MTRNYDFLTLLGGNVGNVKEIFEEVISILTTEDISIVNTSSLYKTEPWGYRDQDWFYNLAFLGRTKRQPIDLLNLFKEIEEKFGSYHHIQWGPRSIDIDLLLYNSWILETAYIQIPHPRFHLRNFSLIPAVEIAPEWVHPKFGKSLRTLLVNSADELQVIRMENE